MKLKDFVKVLHDSENIEIIEKNGDTIANGNVGEAMALNGMIFSRVLYKDWVVVQVRTDNQGYIIITVE